MKIETQFTEDHQAKLTVQFSEEEWTGAKHRAAQQIAKRIRLPGFRPGKAPYNVIERTVGDNAILEAATELMVNERYQTILQEAGIKPYGSGSLESIDKNENPTFHFVVPLEAEITLGDYHAVRIPYELPSVTEDDINRTLDRLREQREVVEPVERPVQAGDQVTVLLSGRRIDAAEGQDSNLISERSQTINVLTEGEDDSGEWPFPGFSSQLIGMNVGEEKTQTYIFGDDYRFEAMRNMQGEFHAVIEAVKTRTLPGLDDDFAKSLGDFENLETLIKRVRENLTQQQSEQYNAFYNNQLIGLLVDQAAIKFPPPMLESEMNAMMDEFAAEVERSGMELATYLKTANTDEATLRESFRKDAERRLRFKLVVLEVGRREKIKVDPQQVQWPASMMMRRFNQNLSPKDARKVKSPEFTANLINSITADVFNQNTIEYLRGIARGESAADPSLMSVVEPDVAAPIEVSSEPVVEAQTEAETAPAVTEAAPEAPTPETESASETAEPASTGEEAQS